MTRPVFTWLSAALVGALGCVQPPLAPPPAALPPLPQPTRGLAEAPRPAAVPAPAAGVVPAAHLQAEAQPKPQPKPGEAEPIIGPLPAPPKDAPPIAGSPPSAGGPLALDEVLAAVERHFPLLRAVEQERAIAGGRLLSTMGAFDFNLGAGVDGQGTTYDNLRTNLGFAQALPAGGLGVFAGYRTGTGEFPNYALGQKTADSGEFRAGISVPLLRDRTIDRPRAAVQQARLDAALAEPTIERQRLDFQRAAARTYWNWVGSGQRLVLAGSLVQLAVERDEQLRALVEAGRLPNIERIDNQQNIALRQGLLIQAQRAFQQATIELSLFLRDESGQPTLAGTNRLPAFPAVPPLDARAFEVALQTAFELRPEPRRWQLLREKVEVERQLARNQMLPTLNAVVAAGQDVGPGKSPQSGPNGLDRSTIGGGLAFQFPVQQREARGRLQAAEAQLVQIEQQLRQAEDVVRAEVQDAYSALERSVEFLKQARQRVELARVVARAERERLRLGQSDVLRVTLREQATFDAEIVEVGAQQDYFRALADFRAAIGLGGK